MARETCKPSKPIASDTTHTHTHHTGKVNSKQVAWQRLTCVCLRVVAVVAGVLDDGNLYSARSAYSTFEQGRG